MSKQLQITIPTPCHENWNEMTASEKGRYCGSCQKQVIDFSIMNDRELAQFFKKPSNGSICGRFSSDQLERSIEIPKKRIPWIRYFFSIFLPALFTSKSFAQGKVAAKEARQPVNDGQTIKGDTTIVETCTNPSRIDTSGLAIVGALVAMPNMSGRVVNEMGKPVVAAKIVTGWAEGAIVPDKEGYFSFFARRIVKDYRFFVTAPGYEQKIIKITRYSNELLIVLKKQVAAVVQKPKKKHEPLELPRATAVTTKIEDIQKPEIIFPVKRGGLTKFNTDESGIVTRLGGVSVCRKTVKVKKQPVKNIPVINTPGLKKNIVALDVYPNPVHANTILTIETKEIKPGDYLLELIGLDGKTIKTQSVMVNEDATHISFTIPGIAAGNYLLHLSNAASGLVYNTKLVVQQ